MTVEQLQNRTHRAESDVFVIVPNELGWRIRSARNPASAYTVEQTEEGSLVCSCPDFQTNATEDPSWVCKHILAVQNHETNMAANPQPSDTPQPQPEPQPKPRGRRGNGAAKTAVEPEEPGATQMLIKRSISPDGRIDSISIEFAFALLGMTAAAIKAKAFKTLKLQTEIVRTFLQGANSGGNGASPDKKVVAIGNGAGFARLIDVGVTNDGSRLFVNVDVNGKRARLFGTAAEIAKAITTAGQQLFPNQVEAGMRLNLACRAITKPSIDGRYINVVKVLPLGSSTNGRAGA